MLYGGLSSGIREDLGRTDRRVVFSVLHEGEGIEINIMKSFVIWKRGKAEEIEKGDFGKKKSK